MALEPPSTPQLAAVNRAHPTLPIFTMDDAAGSILYAPGYAATAAHADRVVLEHHAVRAQQAWMALVSREYLPECLTLYLSNRCNLGCGYCYSAPHDSERARWRLHPSPGRPGEEAFPTLDEAAVAAAATVVAANCERKAKPFSLIFHGGGEPTLHWDLLQRLRERVGAIAYDRGLPLWSYIATNGVMPAAKADWLAEHFSTIGLSCDGPQDLQDSNRPAANGAATSQAVERTAARLLERGATVHVRATITRAAVHRQAEIAAYCLDRLGARVVRFEPAYQAHPGSPAFFEPCDASLFVGHFLAARRLARARGAELHVSGVRIDEIHGAYCNPLRDVLQVSPNGHASACFLTADGDRSEDEAMSLGRYDPGSGEFVIDYPRARTLRQQAARIPSRCHDCVNVYHCARDCPDVCLITRDAPAIATPGFRCRVQKLLAHALIREMADEAMVESALERDAHSRSL